MAWSDEALVVTGDIITAAWGNRRRSNERYLKGQDGPVTIEDEVRFHNDTNFRALIAGQETVNAFDAGDQLRYDRTNNHFNFHTGDALRARIDANGLHSHDGSTLMRVQRHPGNNNRHIESGNSTSVGNGETGTLTNVTFTNAYASAPEIQWGEYGSLSGNYLAITSVNGSGFSWDNRDNLTSRTIHWMADGAD